MSAKELKEHAIETALFRIAQEAAANARKHSGSTRLRVRLQRTPQAVFLEALFTFFLVWLLAALAAGIAIYLVWQRLYLKYVANSSA